MTDHAARLNLKPVEGTNGVIFTSAFPLLLDDYKFLKGKGISKIVSIEGIRKPHAAAQSLGMQVFNFSDAFVTTNEPRGSALERLHGLVASAHPGEKILVHCAGGNDRSRDFARAYVREKELFEARMRAAMKKERFVNHVLGIKKVKRP